MAKNRGFTLIECIVTLSIYTIALSLALGLYLFTVKISNKIELQADTEENLRIAIDRISLSLRRTSKPGAKVTITENRLYIDNMQYYIGNGILYERKDGGVNQLATRIASFNPVLRDKTLIIELEGSSNGNEPPAKARLVIYLGG